MKTVRMVRKHYLNYLEKQLQENFINCSFNYKKNSLYKEEDDEMQKKVIKTTAQLLEDKAVKACMVAKFYQRAMVKIIAIVRRSTEEKKLIAQLEKCIQIKEEHKQEMLSKETQTEAGLLISSNCNECVPQNAPVGYEGNKHLMSLDEKIEMFQKHLQKEKCFDSVKCPVSKVNGEYKIPKRHYKYREYSSHYNKQFRYHEGNNFKPKSNQIICFSPTSSVSKPPTPITPAAKEQSIDTTMIECIKSKVDENDNSNDSVALELARLFSEEKTELDEIFGIDPNEEPDDPQICKILKEIEESKINHISAEVISTITENRIDNFQTKSLCNTLVPNYVQQHSIDSSISFDLSKSIWPCELYMQRRKLSECLARLIEEDLRWHDIMKWKFSVMFGEDSDDEFTPCSPSIELNEVLIGSCIRRISPWVVKYLMQPMRDGLIGNRFLFKKLAKQLSRNIIMENQYPDESLIKNYVENFFCLHQAIMSLKDLDLDMPSILSM